MIYTCTCPYIHKQCVHRRQRCSTANSLNKASGGGGLFEKGYTKLCNYHACTARQRNPSGHCLLMCSYISAACQSVQSANMSSLYNGLAGDGISRCGSPISQPTARSAYRSKRAAADDTKKQNKTIMEQMDLEQIAQTCKLIV